MLSYEFVYLIFFWLLMKYCDVQCDVIEIWIKDILIWSSVMLAESNMIMLYGNIKIK